MSDAERAVTFECAGETLVGVLALPDAPKGIGVLVIVGGPQYRAGSHRQFVLLARSLAAAGFASLRFDHRGAGDSSGAMRSFADIDDDIAAAIDVLCSACAPLDRVVLWGLCDAASAALIYYGARRDPRVAGFVLVNPWIRSETTLARAQVKHYYAQRVLDRAFWNKLVRGELDAASSLKAFVRALVRGAAGATHERRFAETTFQQRMAHGLARFAGPVLLVLSGRDLTAKEFLEHAGREPEWSALIRRSTISRRDLPDADHTCSSARGRGDVERLTIDWLEAAVAQGPR